MKVNAWKNIDIECEVDVSLEDCIVELLDIASDTGSNSRLAEAINGATKIMERITPDMIANVLSRNPKAIGLIRERLQKWIDAT